MPPKKKSRPNPEDAPIVTPKCFVHFKNPSYEDYIRWCRSPDIYNRTKHGEEFMSALLKSRENHRFLKFLSTATLANCYLEYVCANGMNDVLPLMASGIYVECLIPHKYQKIVDAFEKALSNNHNETASLLWSIMDDHFRINMPLALIKILCEYSHPQLLVEMINACWFNEIGSETRKLMFVTACVYDNISVLTEFLKDTHNNLELVQRKHLTESEWKNLVIEMIGENNFKSFEFLLDQEVFHLEDVMYPGNCALYAAVLHGHTNFVTAILEMEGLHYDQVKNDTAGLLSLAENTLDSNSAFSMKSVLISHFESLMDAEKKHNDEKKQ